MRDHPGNVRYRNFVEALRHECVKAPKPDKPLFAKIIVASIRGLTPPGRFLRKGEEKMGQNTGLWYEIGDKNAIAKTSQALREGATEIRKKSGIIKDVNEPLQYKSCSQSATGVISIGSTSNSHDCIKTDGNFLTNESMNIINSAISVAEDAIHLGNTRTNSMKDNGDPIYISSTSIDEVPRSEQNFNESHISRQFMDRDEDMLEEWNFDDTHRRDSLIDENGLEEWGTFRTHNRTHRAFDSLDRSVYVSEDSFKSASSLASQRPHTSVKSVSFRQSVDEKIPEGQQDLLSRDLNKKSSISLPSILEKIDSEIDHRLKEISLASNDYNSFAKGSKDRSGMIPRKPRFGSLSLSHSSDAKQRLLLCSTLSVESKMSICSIFSSNDMHDSDSRIVHNYVDTLIEHEREKVKNAIAARGDETEKLTDEDFLSLYTSDISEMVNSIRSMNSGIYS